MTFDQFLYIQMLISFLGMAGIVVAVIACLIFNIQDGRAPIIIISSGFAFPLICIIIKRLLTFH